MSINYSEITEKLKEIDWEPIAEKALAVLKSQTSNDLSEIPEEDQKEYQDSLLEIAKLSVLHMTANEEEKKVIEIEMGHVRLAMESMEARNNLFAYRKAVEVVGAVLAATIAVALAMA